MNKLIPFRLLPASWGLTGKMYDIASAHYYLSGEALARRLVEIEYVDQPIKYTEENIKIDMQYGKLSFLDGELQVYRLYNLTNIDPLKEAEIKLRHNAMTAEDYDILVAKFLPDSEAKSLALLDIEFRMGRIDAREHAKQSATIRKKPWSAMINSHISETDATSVEFEFDWNSYWIDYLRENGFTGYTDEQVVDAWFTAVCKTQVMLAEENPMNMMAAHDPTHRTGGSPTPPSFDRNINRG